MLRPKSCFWNDVADLMEKGSRNVHGQAEDRSDARLRWLCRRGMKELDVLLSHYLEKHYPEAGPDDRSAFARLLERQDPDLYGLLLGMYQTDDPDEYRVIQHIRRYTHA